MSVVAQCKHGAWTLLAVVVKAEIAASAFLAMPTEDRVEQPPEEALEALATMLAGNRSEQPPKEELVTMASSSDGPCNAATGLCICGMTVPTRILKSAIRLQSVFVCDPCWGSMPLLEQLSMINDLVRPEDGKGETAMPQPAPEPEVRTSRRAEARAAADGAPRVRATRKVSEPPVTPNKRPRNLDWGAYA